MALYALIPACAKTPPSLSPTGTRFYQADRGVVAIGTVQHVAIDLNRIQVCDPQPCHALLSDQNTRIVVDATTTALTTIKAAPSGWAAAATTALERLAAQLDEAGKKELAAYLDAARQIVTTFGGANGG